MKRKLEVKKSAIHGKGLFTTVPIKKNRLLGYCKVVPTKKKSDYTLWLRNNEQVDVTCRFRYINHNSKPNVAYYDDLSVVALRNIAPDEELTHHYGDEWD